jgi:hypothetical protein
MDTKEIKAKHNEIVGDDTSLETKTNTCTSLVQLRVSTRASQVTNPYPLTNVIMHK